MAGPDSSGQPIEKDGRTDAQKQLDAIASGVKKQISINQVESEEIPLLPSGVAGVAEEERELPKVLQQQKKSILEMPSVLPEKSGKKRRNIWGWILGITAGTGLGLTLLGLVTNRIQKWIGGKGAENLERQGEVRDQAEDITNDLIKKAQKEGTDFGEDFKMNDAKEQGANLAERVHMDSSRVFDVENVGSKADIILAGLVIQDPLAVEPGVKPGKDAIFDQRTWSIGQKIFMDMVGSTAQEPEYNIDPNNGGLENWLVTNKKDSVYKATINGQEVEISAAHLLQILWNEYQSGDTISITKQDQALLKAYWEASGRRWSAIEGGKERQKLSWDDVKAIFEMARENGIDAEQVLSNGFTLGTELQVSPAQVEIKALDMAQAETGGTSFEAIFLGFMMVVSFARPRFAKILNFNEIKQKGQELLQKLSREPQIMEEARVRENSRRLVNRIKNGLSLSRTVVMDLGGVLLDPNNQDMRDLILTEGPNWFRHLPPDHPEINYLMNFFGCENYQQLQNLAIHPEEISGRLEKLLTIKIKKISVMGRGKDRREKLRKMRQILTDDQRKIIDLYRLAGHQAANNRNIAHYSH